MSGVLGLLWLFLLLAVAGWASAAIASSLLSHYMFQARLPPAERARRSLTLAAIPLLASSTLLVAVAFMALGKAVGWVVDHCVWHAPGHPHLCFEHLPAISLGTTEAAVALTILLAAGWRAGRFICSQHQHRTQTRSLLHLSPGTGRLRRTSDELPYAFAADAGAPCVVMSRGLLNQLDRRQRRIVLAHELAHLRRRDLILTTVIEWLLLFHLPSAARRIRHAWQQALEERADDLAAARYGRAAVAETLLRVVRLHRGQPVPGLAASGADVIRRVDRLVTTPAPLTPGPIVSGSIGLTAALAVYLASTHHFLETMLGYLTGYS